MTNRAQDEKPRTTGLTLEAALNIIVAAAPRLTPEQITELRAIIWPEYVALLARKTPDKERDAAPDVGPTTPHGATVIPRTRVFRGVAVPDRGACS